MTNRINNRMFITSDEKILQEYEAYKAIPKLTANEFFKELGVAYELLENAEMLDDSNQAIDNGETYPQRLYLKRGDVVVLQGLPRPCKPAEPSLGNIFGNFRPMLLAVQTRNRDSCFVRFICPKLNNKIVAIEMHKTEATTGKHRWGTVFKPIAGHEENS